MYNPTDNTANNPVNAPIANAPTISSQKLMYNFAGMTAAKNPTAKPQFQDLVFTGFSGWLQHGQSKA